MNVTFNCCLVFCVLANIIVTFGADSWTCTANTDYIDPMFACKDLEKRFNTIELQMKQFQKLMQTNGLTTYTTIEGFPKGMLFFYEVK
jgi:hypothetical protein